MTPRQWISAWAMAACMTGYTVAMVESWMLLFEPSAGRAVALLGAAGLIFLGLSGLPAKPAPRHPPIPCTEATDIAGRFKLTPSPLEDKNRGR